MKPGFRVTSSGNDITQQIADRLISLRIQDEAGQKSDTLEITLDDRDQKLPLPEAKVTLSVAMGYTTGGRSLQEMGTFVIDEVELSDPPATVKIRAKAMDGGTEGGQLKEQKTRSWHQKTIGQIVTQIASEHGMTAMVHPRFASKMIDHIDQTSESDAHFLTRLATLHGATAKPVDGRLVFIPAGEGISASGQTLAATTLNRSEVQDYRATIKDRGAYSQVVARYQDKETGTEKSVQAPVPRSASSNGISFLDALFGINTSGSATPAGPSYQDRKLYPTREEAVAAAAAKGKDLASGTVTIDLTCAGRPDIFAERPITLQGFRTPLNATWIIKSVAHEYSAKGFITKITCGTETEEPAAEEAAGSGANSSKPPTDKARLIAAAAARARGMNTRNGPDGGNNACVYAVNIVLKNAGITPPWGGSLYVPTARSTLAGGAGTLLNGPEPGAIAIFRDNGSPPYPHIGIVLADGSIISNSSSRGSFSWVASPGSYASYYGRSPEYWRLK